MKILLFFACFVIVYAKLRHYDFIPNVWIEATTPDSVRIGWSTPAEELDYGLLAYNVTITQEDEILDSEFVHNARFHTFEHLDSGINYGFKVLACDYNTRQCANYWSAEQTADTIDRDPNFVPTVMVNGTSLHSITIGWSAPPAGPRNRIHQYKVMAMHKDPYLKPATEPVYLPNTADSYVFDNLKSGHRYWVRAAACSQYKMQCGNWSNVQEVWTLSPEGETSDATWSTMTIVGVVLLVVLIIVLLVVMAIWAYQRWRSIKLSRRTIATSTYSPSHLVKMNLDDLCLKLKIGDPAELLGYNGVWEFPRNQLLLEEEIGRGEFGVIRKAQARLNSESEVTTTVVVKSVKYTSNKFQVMAFIRELNILANVGKHLNVVNLLGACTTTLLFYKPLMIMEFCRFDNLHNYLLKHRADFISQVDTATGNIIAVCSPSSGCVTANSDRASCGGNSATEASCSHSTDSTHQGMPLSLDADSVEPRQVSNCQEDHRDEKSEPISTEDLLCWAWQVAHGMKYLRSKAILHGDLAARNILLTDHKIVKICDFGLAKILHDDVNSENQKQDFFPVPWLDIESLRYGVLSRQSDIWSYGVVLWEFFSLGEIPFHDKEFDIVYQILKNGYRLERPAYASQAIYQIMLHCWNSEPSQRPSFNKIAKSIGGLLDESVKTRYINLSGMYGQKYVDDLEHGDSYFSSTKRSEQANSDGSHHEESDCSTVSQFDELLSRVNIQLNPVAAQHEKNNYLTPSQFKESMDGENVKLNSNASELGKSNYSTMSQFAEVFGGANIQPKSYVSEHKVSDCSSTRLLEKLHVSLNVQLNTVASEHGS